MNKHYVIGKVYIGSLLPFETVGVDARTVQEALCIAANYLKPNHMQTLTLVEKGRH